MFGEYIWAVVVVAGFVVLGGAMMFAKAKNKAAGVDEPVRPDATPPNYGETQKVD